MHLRAAVFAPTSFLQASSSATTLVVAMFIPADAKDLLIYYRIQMLRILSNPYTMYKDICIHFDTSQDYVFLV